MLFERIFEHIQSQTPIEIEEKEPPHVIAFGDDDGVLPTQIVEARKGGAEHRVGRDKAPTALRIVFAESRFYGSNVRDDAVFGQKVLHLSKSLERMLERDGIDEEFGRKVSNLIAVVETQGVIDET